MMQTIRNAIPHIRVFKSAVREDEAQQRVTDELQRQHDDERVFVTVGAGETWVTVLDEEGNCEESWTAIFGWSYLFELPVSFGERDVLLEEPETVRMALRGHARIYGRDVDTSVYVEQAEEQMRLGLDQILSRTVGSGARFVSIVIAAPQWLHGLLSGSAGLRPHILHEISDA